MTWIMLRASSEVIFYYEAGLASTEFHQMELKGKVKEQRFLFDVAIHNFLFRSVCIDIFS